MGVAFGLLLLTALGFAQTNPYSDRSAGTTFVMPYDTPGMTITDQYPNHPCNWPTKYGFNNIIIQKMNAGDTISTWHTSRTSFSSQLGNIIGSAASYGNCTNDTLGGVAAWVPQNKIHSKTHLTMFTIHAWPSWMWTASTASGHVSMPTDIDTTNETCNAVGGDGAFTSSDGDCMLGYETAEYFYQQTCGVSQRPSSPLTGKCSVQWVECYNEATGGTIDNESSFTVMFQHLSKICAHWTRVQRAYCGDCWVGLGSIACGGEAGGTCYANMANWLTQWHAYTTMIPDAITYHPYQSADNIYPQPMPETHISGTGAGNLTTGLSGPFNGGGDKKCPTSSDTTPPVQCHDTVIENIQQYRLTMHNATWLPAAEPLIGTEFSPYDDRLLQDTTVNSVTGTAWTPDLQVAYLMRGELLIADSISNTGLYPYGGINNNFWYQYDNLCFGTLYIGISTVNCSPYDPTTPTGLTPSGTAQITLYNWLHGSTITRHCLDINGGITGKRNTIWYCDFTDNAGNPFRLVWYTGWESYSTYTTTYTKATDYTGNTTTVSGTLQVGMAPIKLSVPTPTPPLPTGTRFAKQHRGRHRAV